MTAIEYRKQLLENPSPSIYEQKERLRNLIKSREKKLSRLSKEVSDKAIAEQLFALPEFQTAKTIMAYYGVNGEINTVPILERILEENKKLCLPYCVDKEQIQAKKVDNLASLVKGKFDIPTPQKTNPVIQPQNIDLIIVPCRSCSLSGYRLGHGNGYYDRYLKDYHGKTIMLCRESLITDAIPVDEYDVRVSIVVTEIKVSRQ